MRQMDFPIPTGRTPGHLSRATSRTDIRSRYADHGGDPFASHLDQAASSSLRASYSALNCVQHYFSIIESVPLGPPDPPIFLIVSSISCPVMSSGSTVGRAE